MLLQVNDSKDVLALHEKLSELNKHFASAASGLKLYYVKVGCFSLAKITLTKMGDRNSKRTWVKRISSMRAQTMYWLRHCKLGSWVYLGLQNLFTQSMLTIKVCALSDILTLWCLNYITTTAIYILDPGVLILMKMKRWYINAESTWPATILKNRSDTSDLAYLIQWMAERDLMIGFQLYRGKTRDGLLEYVCKYHKKISSKDEDLEKALKKVMKPKDWNSLHTLLQ